jgi:hypothetical protein
VQEEFLGVFLRAVVLLAALSVVLPARALAADVVTLHAAPGPVPYGAPVELSGTIEPAVANEVVGIYARSGGGQSRVASTTTDGLGRFLWLSHRGSTACSSRRRWTRSATRSSRIPCRCACCLA